MLKPLGLATVWLIVTDEPRASVPSSDWWWRRACQKAALAQRLGMLSARSSKVNGSGGGDTISVKVSHMLTPQQMGTGRGNSCSHHYLTAHVHTRAHTHRQAKTTSTHSATQIFDYCDAACVRVCVFLVFHHRQKDTLMKWTHMHARTRTHVWARHLES